MSLLNNRHVFFYDGAEIMIQGRLKKQDSRRYAIFHELNSGDRVEVYVDGEWKSTTIECGKDGYYLTNGTPIDNALIRIQENL